MASTTAKTTHKAPKGTRDSYPEDLLRRRYITESWRAVSIRHGFEEIDGPTFEHSDLYAVKSGEGILGELFQAFSGKSPEEVEQVQRDGRAPYALRPEFTPTLARMYAARASSLGGITRWFCVQPFFRAERPQRGRLREFYQWNCDVLGGTGGDSSSPSHLDVECLYLLVQNLEQLGIGTDSSRVGFDFRVSAENTLVGNFGIAPERVDAALDVVDRLAKQSDEQLAPAVAKLIDQDPLTWLARLRADRQTPPVPFSEQKPVLLNNAPPEWGMEHFVSAVEAFQIDDWMWRDFSVVRGLAYYTGTVFEVIAEGERAVAGGGRYDNLIELFGGPPTPAVGFGMGDVVLTNLLDDRGLMPEGPELKSAIDQIVCTTSLRPEAFVVAAGDEDAAGLVTPLLATLRRGLERDGFQAELADGTAKPWDPTRYDPARGGVRPLHARTTDKATTNPKKLLQDANRHHARFYIQIDGGLDNADGKVALKDLDAKRDLTPNDIGIADKAQFSVRPEDPHSVGRAIVHLLDRV
ncbi:MAG: ATP phosphoribosyltransferase regulatory subunit [Planctomycetota bacterium]